MYINHIQVEVVNFRCSFATGLDVGKVFKRVVDNYPKQTEWFGEFNRLAKTPPRNSLCLKQY